MTKERKFSRLVVSLTSGEILEFMGADGVQAERELDRVFNNGYKMAVLHLDDSDSVLRILTDHITHYESFYSEQIVY